MTAVPSAPATWRVTSFIAEATPAFSSGTAPMTESVAGAMIQPIAEREPKNQSPSGQYRMSGVQDERSSEQQRRRADEAGEHDAVRAETGGELDARAGADHQAEGERDHRRARPRARCSRARTAGTA